MVNYLDLTLIGILVLSVLWGGARGFTKSIRKSFTIVLVIASLICSPLGSALYNTGMGVSLQQSLTSSIGEAGGELLSAKLLYINGEYYLGGQPLNEALQTVEASGVVKMIILLTPMILKGKTDLFVDGGKSFLEIVMPVLTKLLLILISFVIVFVVLKIVLIVVNHLLQKLFDKIKLAKWIDGLLGAILMLIKASMFILVGMWVVSFVAGMDIQGIEVLQEQIVNSTFGKWIIDNNVLSKMLETVFGR